MPTWYAVGVKRLYKRKIGGVAGSEDLGVGNGFGAQTPRTADGRPLRIGKEQIWNVTNYLLRWSWLFKKSAGD